MNEHEHLPSKGNEGNTIGENQNGSFLSRNWAAMLALAAIGFYLITQHSAHLLGVLPWLILLACPFLHFFMHRGHGGHAHSGHNRKEADDAKS